MLLPTVLASTWLVAAAVLLYLYVRQTVLPLWRLCEYRMRLKLQQKTWAVFKDVYLAFADSTVDEAILGLTAVKNGIRGSILPRIASPRDKEFSANRRLLRRPEREYARQTFPGWFLNYLLLPLAIVKDWLITLSDNDVFAMLIDDFVLKQSHKRAIGNDIAGLALQDVSDHPMAEGPMQPASVRLVPNPAHHALLAGVRRNIPKVIDALRAELGRRFSYS